MKQISFSILEALPSLLNHTKTTTLRKAYLDDDWNCPEIGYVVLGKEMNIPKEERYVSGIEEKSPEYEVGEVYEVVWTGEDVGLGKEDEFGFKINKAIFKSDVLGKVRIIKREKIEVTTDAGCYAIIHYEPKLRITEREGNPYCKSLTKTEGFSSPEIMFTCLERWLGDLATPKPLWLYHFFWCKDEE